MLSFISEQNARIFDAMDHDGT